MKAFQNDSELGLDRTAYVGKRGAYWRKVFGRLPPEGGSVNVNMDTVKRGMTRAQLVKLHREKTSGS